MFGVLYQRLRRANFMPSDTLVTSYRHYRHLCDPEPRISFDRAFDLAAHLEGIWIASNPSFAVVLCPRCNSERLAAIGGPSTQPDGCPFCKIIQRYPSDPRIQMSFPTPLLVDPGEIILGIDLLMAEYPPDDADSAPDLCH